MHAPDDTHPAARATLTRAYAAMTPAQKLGAVRELTRTTALLSIAGLRMRHPRESDAQLRHRFVALCLGADVVARAYGTPPPE